MLFQYRSLYCVVSFFCALLFFANMAYAAEYSLDSLVTEKAENNIQVYKDAEGNPVNGTVTENYTSGRRKTLFTVKDGKRDGVAQGWYESGKREWESAPYSAGKRNGTSRGWYENGQVAYEQEFKNNAPSGTRKEWHENGRLKAEKPRVKGRLHGTVRTYDKDGNLESEVVYVNGKAQNESAAASSTGTSAALPVNSTVNASSPSFAPSPSASSAAASGSAVSDASRYAAGALYTKEMTRSPKRKTATADAMSSLKAAGGLGALVTADGVSVTQKDGMEYYTVKDGGAPFSGGFLEYRAGDSLHKLFSIKNGRRHGPSETFYKSGKLFWKTLYEEGLIVGFDRSWHEDGRLRYESAPYVNGKRNGVSRGFYKNGALKYETPYANDKKNGTVHDFYENGKLKAEAVYAKGELVGSAKEYDENGVLLVTGQGEPQSAGKNANTVKSPAGSSAQTAAVKHGEASIPVTNDCRVVGTKDLISSLHSFKMVADFLNNEEIGASKKEEDKEKYQKILRDHSALFGPACAFSKSKEIRLLQHPQGDVVTTGKYSSQNISASLMNGLIEVFKLEIDGKEYSYRVKMLSSGPEGTEPIPFRMEKVHSNMFPGSGQ